MENISIHKKTHGQLSLEEKLELTKFKHEVLTTLGHQYGKIMKNRFPDKYSNSARLMYGFMYNNLYNDEIRDLIKDFKTVMAEIQGS